MSDLAWVVEQAKSHVRGGYKVDHSVDLSHISVV